MLELQRTQENGDTNSDMLKSPNAEMSPWEYQMSLLDDLQQYATRVSQQLAYVHNEDQTKTSLILPFIRLLGYDVFDASEVLPEYAADFGTKSGEKIDYVVMREGKPALLIEAKSARTALHTGHASQLYRYYSTMDTRIGILTNGKSYQLFADLNKTHVMDREPFIVIDMLDFDERMVGVIEGLTKAGFDPELVMARARELNIRREIRARLEKEYASPSADLVRHFAQGLYDGSFNHAVENEFSPIVKQILQEFSQALMREGTVPVDPQMSNVPAESEAQEPPTRITVDGSVLEIPVFAEHLGERIADSEAVLLFDVTKSSKPRIRFGGGVMSPSDSLLKAKQLLNPNRKSTGGRGWYDWMFKDPVSRQVRAIDDLRRDEDLVRRLQGKS